jgi:hypothetical protein
MTTAATDPRALPRPASVKVPAGERVAAAVIASGLLAVLIIAARLEPDPSGSGTHAQLGLPACGWAMSLNQPCPTCGMTTAFALAADARPWDSFKAQPMGFALAVGSAAGFWLALYVAATGSHLGRRCARMLRPRWLWAGAGLFLASWAYKYATWPG